MNEQQKYQKRNLLLFPLGTVGRDAVYALINSFLLTFVLFTRSLNAAQLTAITAIMVAARIFDALNDPIMGSIIEHTHSRFGKFKPWLTIGVLCASLLPVPEAPRSSVFLHLQGCWLFQYTLISTPLFLINSYCFSPLWGLMILYHLELTPSQERV